MTRFEKEIHGEQERMKKCKTCYLINAKPCYECSACASGDDHYKYWPNTIDTVLVVRCKDCKQYNTTGCSKGFGWCENMDMGVSDDFYCANGAKITNKETGETYK